MKHSLIKKILALGVLAAFVGATMTGCSLVDRVTGKDSDSSATTKTVQSSDGQYSMDVPSDWITLGEEFHAESVLSVNDKKQQKAVVVIPESKVDFTDEIDLETYNQLILANIESSATDVTMGETAEMTIDGQPAFLTEVTATLEGLKVAYQVYVANYEDKYVQLSAWSAASQKDEAKAAFEKIVSTFKKTA